jgi:hypothetical protein
MSVELEGIRKARHIGLKKRIINTLTHQGWTRNTPDDEIGGTTFIFQKPLCAELVLWFGRKNSTHLWISQWTGRRDQWPDYGDWVEHVRNPGTFKRDLILAVEDATGADIPNDVLSKLVIRWLLIPGAQVPNLYDPRKKTPKAEDKVERTAIRDIKTPTVRTTPPAPPPEPEPPVQPEVSEPAPEPAPPMRAKKPGKSKKKG